MSRRVWRWGLGLVAFAGLAAGVFMTAPSVAALVSGKSAYVGYFYGGYETSGHYVFQDGLHSSTINSFVSTIESRLNGSNIQNQRGAAFIILTMMGDGGSHSVTEARSQFDDWESLVRAYSSAGLIDFSRNFYYNENSFYQGTKHDVASYYESGTYESIIFKDPNNTSRVAYAIKKLCGNPVGDIGALPKLGWSLSATSYIGIKGKLSYTTGTINVRVGDIVQIKHRVKNTGSGTAHFDRWQMMSAAGGTSYTDGPHIAATLSGGASAEWPGVGTRDHTVTASQLGKKYCARYAVDPRSSTNSSELNSTPVCYIVTAGGGGSISCPVQGTTLANVRFGSGNDGEVTWKRNGVTYRGSPPAGYPQAGDSVTTRNAVSYWATRASVSGVGDIPVVGTNRVDFSPAVRAYPYDSNTAQVWYKDSYYLYTQTWQVDADGNGSWSPTTRSGPLTSAEYDNGSASLGECNYRTFEIEPQGGSARFDNPEYPSSAPVSDNIDAVFGFDGPEPTVGVRSPSRVNGIRLSVAAIVRHADGAPDETYPYGMISAWPSSHNFVGTTAYPTSTAHDTVSGTYRASIPSLRYGDQICFVLTATPGSGTMDQSGRIITSSGSASDVDETCSGHLAARPYLRVFGGDVAVGGGVQQTGGMGTASTCASTAGARISAWNKGLTGGYAGSGAQYAVQALSTIDGFASSLYNPNSNPMTRPPKGLSLSNTAGNPTFGGNFGATPGCKDYVNNLSKDAQKFFTDQEIAGLSLGSGDHKTYYVTGNAYITDNIVYTNSGSWTSPEDMPTFKLVVVGGNIYIKPSVRQLDGLYVAEKDTAGRGGTIVTCAYSDGALPDDELFDDCASSLTVNGSFIANTVQLLRTRGQNGTNYQSTVNERPGNSHAAEIFNYTPEEWLAGPPNVGSNRYDAITSLAPVL